MYNDRITLTMQDILEKEFKIDARGYRPVSYTHPDVYKRQ